jgi:hypothetical protein
MSDRTIPLSVLFKLRHQSNTPNYDTGRAKHDGIQCFIILGG